MGSREDISKPNMNISNGASALAASPSPIPPSIGSNMAQACWNSVLARRRPALQRHTWQAGHSVCCVWGIYQKKRRLQLLPSSFPSSLVSSAFLPPCLLPFVPAATFKEGCPSAGPRTESCVIGAVAVVLTDRTIQNFRFAVRPSKKSLLASLCPGWFREVGSKWV